MMLENIREFVEIGQSVLAEEYALPKRYASVSNIIISGMGGSGIAGDVVKDIMEDELPKPIYVLKKWSLPAFADDDTMFISMSYSGNTVEAISALKDALSRKCKIVGITSGGRICEIFEREGIPYFRLPVDYMPREAMPFMLFIILNLFRRLGWTESQGFDLTGLASKRERIEEHAKEIAKRLQDKIVVIYTKYPSVAHRFKSQLNENSKAVAKYDIITELCHNEINSWKSLGANFHIVFMRDLREPKVVTSMVDITKRLLNRASFTEVVAQGRDKLNRILYLIWLGDFVSYYLAIENKVNPDRVYATEYLKKALSRSPTYVQLVSGTA